MINNVILRLSLMHPRQALIFGVMATAFWYFFLFNDGSLIEANIQSTVQELESERLKEKESDAALKEIATVQAAIASLSEQFRIVSAQLPRDIQMAEIIRTVDKVSQATGLSVKVKEPKPTIRQDVIEVLPLQVTAEGSFSEVTMFFYYLSTIERIVRIKSFAMSTPSESKPGTKLDLRADVVSYKFVPAVEKPRNEGGAGDE